MVTIKLTDILKTHLTNDDGDMLRNEILKHFKNDEKVNVSFDNVYGLNSSFINSAFIDLLKDYDFNYIKNNLVFSDSNKQINGAIRSRFKFEVENCKCLA